MNDLAIKVDHLKKEYILGTIGGKTLYQELQSKWARFRDHDDPNSKIGMQTARYNETFTALNDINLEIRTGAKVGIIGLNGAGKSTLLKVISRVTAPTKGRIFLNGRVACLLEVGTGFHPELTGRENTYLNGAILGMSKKEVDLKMDRIIEFSEIGRFIDTPVKRYSSGMYVRLAFAVAAHLEPEILIVDEVLAVGDYQFQQKCLGKMDEIGNGGRTVLFVSHQLSMIKALCNECILLDHGQVVMHGEVNEVLQAYLNMRTAAGTVSSVCLEWTESFDTAQLLGARIIDGTGRERAEFEVLEQAGVEVFYEIRKPVKGVALGYLLYNSAGAVLHSFDTDTNTKLLAERVPGLYRARVWFPNMLKAGAYTLDLTICRPGLTGIDFRPKLLSFTVNEKNIDTSLSSFAAKREGQFAVDIRWDNEKI